MGIEVQREEPVLRLILEGELGHDQAEELRMKAHAEMNSAIDLIELDMEKLKYMSSTTLGVLVGLKMTAKKHKALLRIVRPSEEALSALRLNSLEKVIDIEQ